MYEEMGLLGPAKRSEGGHRLYNADALRRVDWIHRLQGIGMSLPDIRDFLSELDATQTAPRAMRRVAKVFEKKRDALKAQIAELTRLQSELDAGLAYLKTCLSCQTQESHKDCHVCGKSHGVEAPVLITGLYQGGRRKP